MSRSSVVKVGSKNISLEKKQAPNAGYFSEIPIQKFEPVEETDEELQMNANFVSIIKSLKAEKAMCQRQKEKEEHFLLWIIIIYLFLMPVTVVGVCKSPFLGFSTMTTFWIVNALGCALLLIIFLYQRLESVDPVENSLRVSSKADIYYL